MAKKKKLNKRVVSLLVIIAVIVSAGVAAAILRNLPKDPVKFAKQGDAHFEKGDYVEAIMAYAIAVGASEGDPTYNYKLASAMYSRATEDTDVTGTERRERVGGAIASLKVALRRKPDYKEAQKLLCDIYWMIKSPEYVAEADKLLKLDPDDDNTYIRRAWRKREMALIMRDEPLIEEAIADFRKAVELKKDNVLYRTELIGFYWKLKRWEDVEKTYLEAIEVLPDVGRLRVGYARFLLRHKRRQEARDQVQQAVDRDHTDPIGYLQLSSFYMTDKELSAEERLTKTIEALDEAKKIDDTDVRIYRRLADVHYRRKEPEKGTQALRDGLATVTAQLEASAASAPVARKRSRLKWAREQLSYMLAAVMLDSLTSDPEQREQQMKEIRSCYEVLATFSAKSADALNIAGRIALVEGEPLEAMKLLKAAYEKNRYDRKTALLLVNLYLSPAFDLPGSAERILQEYRENTGEGRSPIVLLGLAKIALRSRDYHKADELLSEAHRADPENKDIANLRLAMQVAVSGGQTLPDELVLSGEVINLLLARAGSMAQMGQSNEAVRLVENIYRRKSDNVRILARLLAMYRRNNQLEKGKEVLRQALQASPNDEMLLRFRDIYDESDPEQRFELLLAHADKQTDPFRRAIEKANICLRSKRVDQCQQFLREAAEINPDAGEVIELDFRCAMLKRDWPKAEEAVRRASAANLDNAKGRFFAGLLEVGRRQYARAIAELLEGLRIRPDAKRERTLLGQCYLSSKDFAKAEETFGEVVGADPRFVTAIVGLAKATEAQANWTKHEKWVRRAVALGSRDPYIVEKALSLDESQAQGEQLSKLIEKREALRKRNPRNFQNLLSLGRLYERTGQNTLARKVYLFLYKNATDKLLPATLLVKFYDRIHETSEADKICNSFITAYDDKVAAYIIYGNFLKRHDRDGAKAAFDKAIAADPKNWRGHLVMAQFQAAGKNWSQAIQAMKLYLKLMPDRTGEKQLAQFHLSAEQFAEAGAIVKKLLQEDSRDLEAWILKGNLSTQQGDLDSTEQILTEALRIDRNFFLAMVNRAMVYWTKGEPGKARNDLKQAARLTNNIRVGLGVAKTYLALRDVDDARYILEDIIEREPETVGAIDMLIGIYMTQKNWEPLAKLLTNAKKAFPGPKYVLSEVEMLRRRGQPRLMMAALESAQQADPESLPVLMAYLETLVAAKSYEQVIRIAPQFVEHATAGPWVRTFEAAALVGLNRSDEADRAFCTAIEKASSLQLVRVGAQLTAAYGQEQSIRKLKGWVQKHPDSWRLRVVLANLCAKSGDLVNAEKNFVKAGELAATNREKAETSRHEAVAYYSAAISLPKDQAGKLFSKSEKAYRTVLSNRKNDEMALNNLAYLLSDDLGKPQEALPYARSAARLTPGSGNVLDTYGWTFAKLGNLKQAEMALVRALQQPEPRPTYRRHLGWVFEQTGRPEKALKQYKQALEMTGGDRKHPLYAEIQADIERLRPKS